MIIEGSILQVADNTGVRKVKCCKVLSNSVGSIGTTIVISVKETMPNNKIKKGSKHRAVIVRTTKETRRADGTYTKFDENAVVLINKDGNPLGTRVFGPIPRQIRNNYAKIASLAPETV